MTTEILSDVAFHDPDNLIPYAELDDAIIRNVTLGMLDFSNPNCHAGGSIVNGAVFNSLTTDGADATAANAFDAVANGLLKMPPAVSGPKVNLPSSFILPANCKHFLAILWLKAPKTGHAGTGSLYSLMGVLNNTTSSAQWGFGLQNNAGTINNLKFYFPVSASSAGEATIGSTSIIDALLDGTLHQVALEWEANAGAGTFAARIYVDRVLVGSATGSYAGSITVPATTPTIGRASSSFIATYADGVYVGRPSLWNLTDSARTVASILEDDAAAAAGYLA